MKLDSNQASTIAGINIISPPYFSPMVLLTCFYITVWFHLMNCPECNKDKNVIKAGLRDTRKGTIQRFYCKKCHIYFSNSTQPYTQYPLHVILYVIEQYNKGYPVKEVKRRTGRKYSFSPPVQTIYSWIKRYRDLLTFIKLRKKYSVDPENLTTTYKFNHQQIYPFTYHNLKLNLSGKQLPQLKRYIHWVERQLPHTLFLQGPRASQITIHQKTTLKQMKNNATELARCALASQQKNQSAHEVIEHFFLINDSTTICTELPVFLNPKETRLFNIDTPLTGHIDIIQIRYNKLYIMDYKPNLGNPNHYSSQLIAYKKALHKRTAIPEKYIIPAVFNKHQYFEFIS